MATGVRRRCAASHPGRSHRPAREKDCSDTEVCLAPPKQRPTSPFGHLRTECERLGDRVREVREEETGEPEAGDAPGAERKSQSFHTAQVDSRAERLAAKLDGWSVTHAKLTGEDCPLTVVPGLQLLQEAPHQVQVATHAATRSRGLRKERSDPERLAAVGRRGPSSQ